MRNFLTASFIASVLSTACLAQEPPVPIDTPAAAGKPARITLGMEKVQFTGDEDVVLNITLENTGTTPLELRRGEIEMFYEFEVTGTDGKKVSFLPSFIPIGSLGKVSKMTPGEKMEGWVYLNRIVDFSWNGKYMVKVLKKMRPSGESSPDKEDAAITVTSEPLNFEITRPAIRGGWGTHKTP
jgi:hypothetical protein